VYEWPRLIIALNVVKISCLVVETLQYFELSKWTPPPSWIFKIGKFYWLLGRRGSRRISMPNFIKIDQSVVKILRFFQFFKMVAAAILDCQFTKFYWLTVAITLPNFVKIGHSIAEMLQFFEFSRWPPPPSWIFEITKFYRLLGWRGSRRIIMPNFVKIGQTIAKILKFFDFSRWWLSAILDLFGTYFDHPQWVLGVSITLQNLVMIDAVVFIIWTFQYLARFHAPKIVFWGILMP